MIATTLDWFSSHPFLYEAACVPRLYSTFSHTHLCTFTIHIYGPACNNGVQLQPSAHCTTCTRTL